MQFYGAEYIFFPFLRNRIRTDILMLIVLPMQLGRTGRIRNPALSRMPDFLGHVTLS